MELQLMNNIRDALKWTLDIV